MTGGQERAASPRQLELVGQVFLTSRQPKAEKPRSQGLPFANSIVSPSYGPSAGPPRAMLAISASLQSMWCLLFLSLIFWAALAPTASAFPLPNSSPLYQFDGQVRLRHLYTADEQTHLFLEILLDGRVRGSKNQNPFSLLEIKAVKPGVIRMQGAKTSRFLCMTSRGHLYGSEQYSEEACNFRETVLHDGYNLYYSEHYDIPVSLSSTGALSRNRQLPPFSQFLPLVNRIPLDPVFVDYDFYEQELDVESADPLSMMGQAPGFMSPSYVF